uniref:Aminotransferase-like plant mobile domain-containing protein n=2 Tax=Quercus lobata TaxID=97700 RepID=A0A7N2M973_QUELO
MFPMYELSHTIIEEREESMISIRSNSKPTFRTAHFLKPSLTHTQDPDLLLPPLPTPTPTKPTIRDVKNLPLNVLYRGRRNPQRNWKEWVYSLQSKHQSTWKKAGIYDAIWSSTYQVLRHNELVLGIADRWCPETNSFIFPWAEATITLEDMMVLGGFSVLGSSVKKPIKTKDMLEIEDSLIRIHRRLSPARHYVWMDFFMGSGHKLEHEAFLSLWLSRYVFPTSLYDNVGKHLFPIAICLSRGTRMALAPAVLATIYRDLRLLKEKIDATRVRTIKYKGDRFELDLWAPFQLVQLWIWERFPRLRPIQNIIKRGEPRVARWHKVKRGNIEKARLVMDSARDNFQWRPYAAVLTNWLSPKFYRNKEEWVSVGPHMDKEIESFALCMRACELVGLECIEQYLPHRVAMQFGMDQDIPICVPRFNLSHQTAWRNYCRPISDQKLHIPHRLFESDVTTRYMNWWKKSMLPQTYAVKGSTKQPRLQTTMPESSKRHKDAGDVKERNFKHTEMFDKNRSARFRRVSDGKPSSGTETTLPESSKRHKEAGDVVKERNFKHPEMFDKNRSARFRRVSDGKPSSGTETTLPENSKRHKEAGDVVKERNFKHMEMFEKKSTRFIRVSDAKPSSGTQSQYLASLNARGRIVREEKVPVLSKVVGGSQRATEVANDRGTKFSVKSVVTIKVHDEEPRSQSMTSMSKQDLEVRISKLEKELAELKEEYNNRLGKQLKEQCSSVP